MRNIIFYIVLSFENTKNVKHMYINVEYSIDISILYNINTVSIIIILA